MKIEPNIDAIYIFPKNFIDFIDSLDSLLLDRINISL